MRSIGEKSNRVGEGGRRLSPVGMSSRRYSALQLVLWPSGLDVLTSAYINQVDNLPIGSYLNWARSLSTYLDA